MCIQYGLKILFILMTFHKVNILFYRIPHQEIKHYYQTPDDSLVSFLSITSPKSNLS